MPFDATLQIRPSQVAGTPLQASRAPSVAPLTRSNSAASLQDAYEGCSSGSSTAYSSRESTTELPKVFKELESQETIRPKRKRRRQYIVNKRPPLTLNIQIDSLQLHGVPITLAPASPQPAQAPPHPAAPQPSVPIRGGIRGRWQRLCAWAAPWVRSLLAVCIFVLCRLNIGFSIRIGAGGNR